MKKPTTFPLFFLILILISSITSPVYTLQSLSLTVTTDKQAYYPEETVQIYANLTSDGTPVTDGLVGLQVQTPTDTLLIIRTMTTGTVPPTTPYVEVRSVIPCNSSGDPKESFKKGTLAYFKITVTNYDIQPREALMTISTYDPNNTSFCSESIQTMLKEQWTSTFIISVPIPEDATTGNATAYANAYTDWPKLAGTPYCPEKSSTFQIINGELSQATTATTKNKATTTLEVKGSYNTSFRLAPRARAGNYTIYVSSRYFGEETFNNTTFRVRQLGDINDDGKVDYQDLFLFRQAYIYEYNPDADLNHDGEIDYQDAFIFRQIYVESA